MEMFSLDDEAQDTLIPALPESVGIPASPQKPSTKSQTKEQIISFKDAEFERRRTQLIQYVHDFQAKVPMNSAQISFNLTQMGGYSSLQKNQKAYQLAPSGIAPMESEAETDGMSYCLIPCTTNTPIVALH